MPYRSLAQERFFHSPGAKRAGISKATVKEFDNATRGRKLPSRVKKHRKSIGQMYQSATQGLQNYGRNLRTNLNKSNRDWERGKMPYYGSTNPFPNPLAAKSYQKTRKRKSKPRIVVDNHLKGSYGETDIQKGRRPLVKINVKKHKGDKAELADTIKHEMYHVKHPKATEKTTYKAIPKHLSLEEQNRLIAKLETRKRHYKMGAIKRRLKIGRHEKLQPGDLIRRAAMMSD